MIITFPHLVLFLYTATFVFGIPITLITQAVVGPRGVMCFEFAHLVVVMDAPFHGWPFDKVRVEIGGIMGLLTPLRPPTTTSDSFVSSRFLPVSLKVSLAF